MKNTKAELVTFIVVLPIALTVTSFLDKFNISDVQLHDTYYAADKTTIFLVVLSPLTLIAFLILGFIKNFRNVFGNLGIIIGLILVTFILYKLTEIQNAFLENTNQIVTDNQLSSDEYQERIKWLRVIILGCLLATGLTGFRTFKLIVNKK